MRLITVLAVCIAAVVADTQSFPRSSRIVGGTTTTIEQWPYQANVMFSQNAVSFSQSCGGTIINNRSILTAAHCARGPGYNFGAHQFRLRLGSTWASSGGAVHNVVSLFIHPSYNIWTIDSDIMVMRSPTNFVNHNGLRPASIAGPNYNLGDNQVVWVTGWGAISQGGPGSEQLRQVQVWTVNQNICAQRYGGNTITANMLCTGWLDVGGRDACQGDSGGPVFHNRVVVGVTSFGRGCALASHPGVNARVSRFTAWIQSNA